MKNKIFRLLMPATLLAALLALTSCAGTGESELTYATSDAATVAAHFNASGDEPVTETPKPAEIVEPAETYYDKDGGKRAIAANGEEAYVAEAEVYYWEGRVLHLMDPYGNVMSVEYGDTFPFMFYTTSMTEAKPANLRPGTLVRIEYTSGTPTEIFEKKQYEKLISLRVLEYPETAIKDFGVVKAVEDDRLLVYLGRCDDINDIDRSACTYVPTKYVPVLTRSWASDDVLSEKIEIGDYVSVHHNGVLREGAPRECTDVYSVSVYKTVTVQQFLIAEIESKSFVITNERNTIRISAGLFDSGYVFENGQPVSADSIHIGDVIEIEWSGEVLASFPGQLSDFYVARIVSRTDEIEYLGVVKENQNGTLLVYFSGADRSNSVDIVGNIDTVSAEDCLKIIPPNRMVCVGASKDDMVSSNAVKPGDRVWVTFKGEGFENAPSEDCFVSRVGWYQKITVELTVSEIRKNHIVMRDAEGLEYTFSRSDYQDFLLFENGKAASLLSLKVGDRVEFDHGGRSSFSDGTTYYPQKFAMRIISRSANG